MALYSLHLPSANEFSLVIRHNHTKFGADPAIGSKVPKEYLLASFKKFF